MITAPLLGARGFLKLWNIFMRGKDILKRAGLVRCMSLVIGAALLTTACGSKTSEQSDELEISAIEESSLGGSTAEDTDVEEAASKEELVYAADSFPTSDLEEVGIHSECIELIENIIESDIEYGFSSAQLAIVKSGKLVYAGSFGKKNTKNDSENVNNDTLYDIASISKMIGVNYALQKLVTDGEIDIDTKIVDYLGQEFVDDTIYIEYEEGESRDLEEIKAWKAELTIRNLLKHQGGFPASPKYFNPTVNPANFEFDVNFENPLFAGNGADDETRQETILAINRTPLMYEPGSKTLYSDVDYMILGLIVEKVTGQDLDTYLKQTFCSPMGLKHITYNPLENGFDANDCAATELNGNTRDGYVYFDGIRTETIQGQVHDEMAYYSMGGISGHAGIFASATDLAKLGTLMLDGTYGDMEFFSREVIDEFTSPRDADQQNWGLGWWRQGDMQRVKYFGTKACSDTFGHQGWTGTLLMIDPEKELVIAYLTNKINTPVTDTEDNPNKFNGNWYTAGSLGFVPEILYIGMDEDIDVSKELSDYVGSLVEESNSVVTDDMEEDHPARLNAISKQNVYNEMN